MCLWYKKQSKYSVQISFVTLNKKTSGNPPLIPKDRVPKTISNLLQSPPIYTDSVASRNESFHLFYVHSEYLETTEIHNEPTDVSLSLSPSSSHSLTTSLSVKVVLSLAGPQGALTNHLVSFSPSHTHSLRLTETHTYINKAQWIELWSNTSMNTPNWSSLLYKKGEPVPCFFVFVFHWETRLCTDS